MSGKYFCLENEEYIERCGEIFRTNTDTIVIHCTMCEDKFRGFDVFVVHIGKEHTNSFCSPNANASHESEKNEENEALIQREITDRDLIDMFDLTYLENCLMNFDPESILNIDLQKDNNLLKDNESQIDTNLQTFSEISETPPADGVHLVVREVRKCNIQSSIEERPHKCTVCGLGFKDKYNMQHHIKRHSTDRKYECSKCNKKFYTGYELRIHLKTHMQKRPFPCTECERTFRTNALLVSHKKRHTNQRDFKCPECSKEFYEKRNLQEHMLIHNKERHFACSLCNAVFLLRKSLLRHKRIHENRKTLKCELCNAVFVQSRGLSTHMKKKHHEM